ncbi:MAG: hypothetical protein OEX03_08635 [Gammaproteobacteria bacterium]|nr:hypothetical protein [Gammaproteobacteria bacterium]
MKKLPVLFGLLSILFTVPTYARDVLFGTDLLATIDNTPNLFYQDRLFNNSAYRISGSSTAAGLTTGLGFRFYLDRYTNGAYLQGDINLNGSTVETGGRLGIDIKMGNIIIDPYISSASRSYGLSIGFKL